MIQLNSHLRSIDIMKGIAMIMVILVHYEQSFNMCEWFYYLKMGCPIFFVCSGFGVMSLIKRKYSLLLENTNELHLFYYSRFKALAPGWYLALIIIFLINTIVISFNGCTLKFGANRNPLAILLNLLFLNGFFPFCNNDVESSRKVGD